MSYGCFWISYASYRFDTYQINSFYLKCYNKKYTPHTLHLYLRFLYSWGVSLTSVQPAYWEINTQKAGCSLTAHDSTNYQLQYMHRWLIGFITVFTALGRGTPLFSISLKASTSSTRRIHVLSPLGCCCPTWSKEKRKKSFIVVYKTRSTSPMQF